KPTRHEESRSEERQKTFDPDTYCSDRIHHKPDSDVTREHDHMLNADTETETETETELEFELKIDDYANVNSVATNDPTYDHIAVASNTDKNESVAVNTQSEKNQESIKQMRCESSLAIATPNEHGIETLQICAIYFFFFKKKKKKNLYIYICIYIFTYIYNK
ncbi:hypothetical protein RFI_13979, partial [Reticulomyxa filosa]